MQHRIMHPANNSINVIKDVPFCDFHYIPTLADQYLLEPCIILRRFRSRDKDCKILIPTRGSKINKPITRLLLFSTRLTVRPVTWLANSTGPPFELTFLIIMSKVYQHLSSNSS